MWSGTSVSVVTQFTTASLAAGVHALERRYTKKGSLDAGADTAWIDDITILQVSPTCRLLATDPSNCGACGTVCPTLGGSAAGPDAIYYVVVPATRTVTFSACSTGCTNYDSTLSLRAVCNAPATVACRDDGCNSPCTPGGSSRQSTINPGLMAGIYYFAVDGYQTNCGNYTIGQTGL
ncbi:MAG: hypothetical protein WCJ30_18510 [Deltaproteobacteria bacterium]